THEILNLPLLQPFLDVDSTDTAVRLLELIDTLPQSSRSTRPRSSQEIVNAGSRAAVKPPPSTPPTSLRHAPLVGMKVSTSRPNSQQSKYSEGLEYDETPRVHAEVPAAKYMPWQSPTSLAYA